MFHTTEPTMSEPIRALLEQVTGLVSKGYYSYATTLGPEDDMPAFEREVKDWVDGVKRTTATTHPLEGLQFLNFGRYCFLLATPGLHDVLAQDRVALEDIRQKPLPCCGYGISCKKLGDGYTVVVHGPSGAPVEVSRR